jgi:hypothetical protein
MQVTGADRPGKDANAGYAGNVNPAGHFLEIVDRLVTERPDKALRIAEIGVDKGATTFELVKVLRKGDRLDLFDWDMCTLASNLDALRAEARCEVEFFPNTTKVFDSYFWTIARMRLAQRPEEAASGTWDAVYLDGSHTYPADAPTTCLLKEMVTLGGFLVLDDVFWSMAGSPTSNNARNRERYTEEQMAANHVEMIVELFMRSDPRFRELSGPKARRAVFQKASG